MSIEITDPEEESFYQRAADGCGEPLDYGRCYVCDEEDEEDEEDDYWT